MDKARDSTNSEIWPDSTCAISVRRNGQILLVVESLVLSTTMIRLRWRMPSNSKFEIKGMSFESEHMNLPLFGLLV